MDVGIIGYGAYIPKPRIKVEEIAKIWGKDPVSIKRGLLVEEKAVAGMDEDTITIATEASRNALKRAQINPKEIGAIYIGSESHPYAVKPTATIVAEAIQATPNLTAADYEFACKASTAALQNCVGLIMSNLVKYAIAGGADTAQGAPGDPLEYAAASGGASVIVAKKTSDTVAFFEGTFSFTTDTPDFWRRELKPYPAHGGRFTGEPSYFRHVISCTAELMERLDLKPTDIDYVVFHQPNGKFPLKAGNILGFPPEKIKPGLLVTKIGNTYSGSSMISLCAILDIAKPGDRILVTSYGSGAGSDSFSIVVQDAITEKVGLAPKVEDYVKSKKYISYAEYVKYRKKIVTG